jgi:hypothetical protein
MPEQILRAGFESRFVELGKMRKPWTPSIVPSGYDQTVYTVVDDSGPLGRETPVEEGDLETTITDLMSGQYSDPVRIVAFNTVECWAEDVSEDFAREILRRINLAGAELPPSLETFIERHIGPERQLTLRLA